MVGTTVAIPGNPVRPVGAQDFELAQSSVLTFTASYRLQPSPPPIRAAGPFNVRYALAFDETGQVATAQAVVQGPVT